MKRFISAFKEKQTELLGLIAKGKLYVSSVNGIPSGKEGLTFDKTAEIYSKYKTYLKESGQVKKDETKIVVSKNLFLNFLAKNKFCNLFLFGNLNGESKTKFVMQEQKAENIRELYWDALDPKGQRDNWYLVFMALILFVVSVVIFSGFPQEPESEKLGLPGRIFVGSIFMFLSIVLLNTFITEKKKFIKRQTEKVCIKNKDFFFWGHDANSNPDDKLYKLCEMSILFSNMPEYPNMIATAIALEGKIGYIIRRDCEIDIDFKNESLTCRGVVMPIIILKESVIFDVAYLQIIDGYVSLIRSILGIEPEKDIIPQIDLEPQMFL